MYSPPFTFIALLPNSISKFFPNISKYKNLFQKYYNKYNVNFCYNINVKNYLKYQ